MIVLDTPGGLDDVDAQDRPGELGEGAGDRLRLADGARAASAGVWISQAADVLAMAPNTNIGSSTPITSAGQNIGSDLQAQGRQRRGRLAAQPRRGRTAERDVGRPGRPQGVEPRGATRRCSINVIDLIAPTCRRCSRRSTASKTKPRGLTLHTAGDTIVNEEMGFFTRLLDTLIDPNLLSLLFLAGIGGIVFEVFHPGVVLPGALGAVALVHGLFGFSVLPTSWAGVALIVLGDRVARDRRARREARRARPFRARSRSRSGC